MNNNLFSPPAEVRPAVSLADLAARANNFHKQCEASAMRALHLARDAGAALNDAKRHCGHGGFTPWLQQYFDGSARTARAYILIFKRWDRLKTATGVANLSIREALAAIRNPSPPRDSEPGPRPWADCPIDDRRDLCLTWWDILHGAVRLYDAAGWEPADIADFFGVSLVDDVLPILQPRLPVRGFDEFKQIIAGAGHYPTDRERIAYSRALMQWYTVQRDQFITQWQWNAYSNAARHAPGNGLSHLRAGLEAQADSHHRQWKRQQKQIDAFPKYDSEQCAALWLCAGDDVRFGLGIEKDQDAIRIMGLPLCLEAYPQNLKLVREAITEQAIHKKAGSR